MPLLSSVRPVFQRLSEKFRTAFLIIHCLAVAMLMPMAALAQSATVVVNPSTFSAAGQQLTFTYTVDPGSYSMTSITAVSQMKSIPITCQTPNDTNPFTCTGVYTVDALDDMSGSLSDNVSFSGTPVGGNISFMGPNVTVLKSGGGPVSLDVSTSPNPSIPGSNVTVTVSLSSMGCNAGVLPPGPVSVTVGPDTRNVTPVPPFPGASGGSVSYTLSTLPTGSHAVTASFAATSGCAAGSFSGLTHTVEPQPTVTIGTAVQTGDSLAFPVTFSVPVTGFTASDVTVNSTAGGTTTVVTGSGASYTATISGMNLAGNVAVSVAANRASSAAGSRNLASNTSTAAYTPMTIDVVTVPAPVYDQPYSFGPFTVTNGTGPFSFTLVSGPLPSGITLSPGGSLSGTTRQTGPFTFSVRAQDVNGRVAVRIFNFSIAAPTISLTPATLPDGTVGTAYSETVNASGGATPYSYAVTSGALPAGLTLSTASGSLSGTPTAAGTFNFGITATDGGGFTASQNYSVTIGATVPGAPQGVSVSLSGQSATVSFSPPLSDGGSPVVDYVVVFVTGPQTISFFGVQSPYSVTGLTYGTEYAISVRARSAIGTGPGSVPIIVTPKATQTITFDNPGTQTFGTAPTLAATASSGLPVSFTSSTPAVCTTTTAGQLTFNTSGTCTIQADQAGNTATEAAVAVSQSFAVNPVSPSAPLPPVATAGDTMATVSFTAPASNGGSLITGYQVTSSPEGITANGVASPILVSGLTNGVSYTFTVRAENATGFGPASAPSNAVTPQASQTITFANPGPQIQFTTPTLTASASSGLPVAFASTTPGVCSVSSAGLLTLSTPGMCTIEASQAGSSAYLPATTVSQSFEVLIPPPIATDSAVSVPFNSVGNVIPAVLSGGPATNIVLVSAPANGSMLVGGGLTATYSPIWGFFGTDSFSYYAVNSTGNSNTATVTITVLPPTPTISPSTLTAGRVASPYSASFTGSNGIGPYTFAVTAGSLPGGLTLATDGTLSGTPTTVGSFPFTVTLTDGASGQTAFVDVTLQIDEQIPVAGNNAITVAANSTDNPVDLNLSGGAAAAITITTPPTNGTVTVTGTTVTYTPTAGFSGTDTFSYIASNAGGTSNEGIIDIQVSPPILSISPSVLPQARVGVPYSTVLTASLGTAPYTFVPLGGAMPTGFTLAPDGTLSGTPTGPGVASFSVQVTDANGATGTATLDFLILEALPVAANSSLTVAANAGATPVPLALSGGPVDTITVTSPPQHGTATVSGASVTYTPTAGYSGPDSFDYIAANSDGTSGEARVSITVTPPVLTVAPSTLPSARVGTAFLATFTAGLGTAPYSFAVTTGALPAGLALASDGTLSGTPTVNGSFAFTVTATDANGATGSAAVTLAVDEEIPVAGASSLTVAANSGATPVPLSLSGGAATSLAITTAPLHGTATVSGTTLTYTPTPGYSGPDSLAYTAINSGGVSAPATVSITVTPPVLTVAPSTLASGRVGTALSASFTADLGTAPYSFAVTAGALPAGLALATDGTLSGTPTAEGSFAFTVTATDALGATGSAAVTLLVDPPFEPVVPRSFTATVVSEGTVIIDVAEGATGNVLGGTVLGVTPPEAGTAIILPTPAGLSALGMPVRLQFTAAAGFLGAAQVNFALVGPAGPSAPAAVQITVIPAAGPLDSGDAFALASAQADAATRMARDRMNDLHGHMRKLRSSDCLSNTAAFSLTGPGKSTGESGTTASMASSQCSTLAQGDVGVWVTGSLSFGTWKDSSFSEELDHASRSLTLGMDYRLSDRAIAGIALSMSRDVTDIGTLGTETTNRSTGATLYLTYGLDNDFYVDGLVGAAALDFSSRRWVASDGAFALGERDGRQVYFSVALGKDFSTDARDLEGYLRISGSRSVLSAFTETGTISALTYQEQEVKSLVGAIGFSTGTEVDLPTGTLRPSLTGELSHEFSDAGMVGVSYAGLGVGTLFQRDAATRSRTDLSLGIGFDFQHMNGWELDGEVGLRVNGDGLADTSVKLKWQMQF